MDNINKVSNNSLNTLIVQKQEQYYGHAGESFSSFLNDAKDNGKQKEKDNSEALKSHLMELENRAKLNKLLISEAA